MQRHVPPASGLQLHQLDRSATGLANTSYFDWQAELGEALREYHPDLVLICLGGNDEQGFDVGGRPVQFGAAAWETAYRERVRRLISEATASGAEVMWVGLPVMSDPSYSAGIRALDQIYQQETDANPEAAFVPTWSLLAAPDGRYASEALVDGSPASLREADGIHLSFAGEDVVATYVIRALAEAGHVRLAPVAPRTITGWP